ncbi:hypothetical protein J2Y48_003464 [Mycoplana sp. BE70]|uniref:hypothetical protein n=1 Tax=Mycoplana sp. BE70 TaxID=2817775 RepID=UPI00286255B6|nr:hypothetical protein [Mycoplana sp. BE70]MDR6758165.1 hypothetical protein [Mycoplana sp. BE70]
MALALLSMTMFVLLIAATMSALRDELYQAPTAPRRLRRVGRARSNDTDTES